MSWDPSSSWVEWTVRQQAHVFYYRTRVNTVANIKIKNNLLALTLILTSLPPSLTVSKVVIEQICYTIGQYLDASTERPELGFTALHCTSTLLSASLRPVPSNLASSSPAPSPILQHAALHLLSPLITFISETVLASASSNSSASDVMTLEGVKEAVKALITWTSGLGDDIKSRGYAVLLPTLCLLLDPTTSSTASTQSPLHALATNTLLNLAQSAPRAFKDATMSMDVDERKKLEKAVRNRVEVGQARGAQGAALEKKGIELKSFG